MNLPSGSAAVCLDATGLINYNRIDHLDLLEDLLPEIALTPDVVKNGEVVKNLSKYPENKRINEAPWLRAVKVEEPDDLRFVAKLLALWGSDPGRDEGEAEVITLCRRHGWTAVLDDRQARETARNYKVNVVCTASVVMAASALSVPNCPSRRAIWELHQRAEACRGARARLMPVDDAYRQAFMTSIKAFRKHWQNEGQPPWPHILASPKLDEIVFQAVKRAKLKLPNGAIQRSSRL